MYKVNKIFCKHHSQDGNCHGVLQGHTGLLTFPPSHRPPYFSIVNIEKYSDSKSQHHYTCSTSDLRKTGNIKTQPMIKKHCFAVLFILSVQTGIYFASEKGFA